MEGPFNSLIEGQSFFLKEKEIEFGMGFVI